MPANVHRAAPEGEVAEFGDYFDEDTLRILREICSWIPASPDSSGLLRTRQSTAGTIFLASPRLAMLDKLHPRGA